MHMLIAGHGIMTTCVPAGLLPALPKVSSGAGMPVCCCVWALKALVRSVSRKSGFNIQARGLPEWQRRFPQPPAAADTSMNLADIKQSDMPRRRLYQIERQIVREATDLWCREQSFYSDNFAADVQVDMGPRRFSISFANTARMQRGTPEATVNDMMRGLILTMAADAQGRLLEDYAVIVKNILDVFFHRLMEIADRKFIYQRLQSLELGFGIVFGLGPEFFPLRSERRVLEEILTSISMSSASETAAALINDIIEAGTLAQRELGVTFHIFMASENAASFLSLPLGMEQAQYISLLGTHTLRCNILAEVGNDMNVSRGILKIDAPQKPLNFIHHKGLKLDIREQALMDKLCAAKTPDAAAFSADEMLFMKVLFNEYVELAGFLLSSGRVAPGLRLLIIFPRIDFFGVLHALNRAIPGREPETLGELAGLAQCRFKIRPRAGTVKPQRRSHVPEKLIQRHVLQTTQAFARSIIKNIYKPVSDIRRACITLARMRFSDPKSTGIMRQRLESISAYLKRLQAIEQVVIEQSSAMLDLDASSRPRKKRSGGEALPEIISDIQLAELEQVKEVVVAKMIEYLSFVSVRLEQIERISSPGIKNEIVQDIAALSQSILNQARSFYKLMTGRPLR